MAKVLRPNYMHEFATTALMAAYVFDANDIGLIARDMELDRLYLIVRAGTGVAALASLTSTLEQGIIGFPLFAFRITGASGDVGNAAANGGLLASDTVPILRGDAAEAYEIAWAAGQTIIVGQDMPVPPDFDGRRDATLQLGIYTDNAGGGGIDAGTFTVETSWDGGALVVDTANDGTPAVTRHTISATIAAADIPDSPNMVSLALTLNAHANDPIQLVFAKMLYFRK